MNWDDLRYLLATVRRGNFSGAAEELGVNRTTVARRIAALEKTQGQPLLESSGEGMRASARGKQLLDIARRMEQNIRDSNCNDEADSAGPLRLAAPTGLGAEFMPELIRFCAARPGIELELITSVNPATLLNQRQADIGIIVADQPAEHLRGPRVCELLRAPYGAQSYLQKYPANLPLHQHQWVAWGRSMSHTLVARWMQANLPADVKLAARVDSWTVMREAVVGGIGVSYLWCFLADSLEQLQRIRDPEPALSTELWLQYPADIPPNPRVLAMLEDLPALLLHRVGREA